MNKEFIKKVIQIKRLEYEAFKQIMPSSVKNKVDKFENEVFNLVKDIAFEIINDDMKEKVNVKSKNTKKISVDFN